jgi:hypothetical protein
MKSVIAVSYKLVRTFAIASALKKIADKKINLILATDHGSVRVKRQTQSGRR